MKGHLILLLMLALGPLQASETRAGPTTYYVQLIRGVDSDQSPMPGCKRIGPALAKKFHAVFKWKHYWEVASRRVEVAPGNSARVRLNTEREVEINLTDPKTRTVAAYHKGTVMERTICPRGQAMTFIGGDERNSAWFIVVRRDKPGG